MNLKQVYERAASLKDAISMCARGFTLITSDGLSSDESIHGYNDKLYYEDGCCLGDAAEAYDFLLAQVWCRKAYWYVIGYFTSEEVEELENIHKHNRYMEDFRVAFREFLKKCKR